MKQSLKNLYMDIAVRTAQESKARRLKVGCIVVKDEKIISFGYNGTPPGKDNNCEHETIVYDPVDIKALNKVAVAGCYLDGDIFTYNNETYQIRTEIDNTWGLIEENIIYVRLTTKHTVRHAEFNAIGKLTRSSESSTGASVFMTHTPCEQCADLMLMAGIKELYYLDKYRTTEGLIMLEESGVYVEEFTRNS